VCSPCLLLCCAAVFSHRILCERSIQDDFVDSSRSSQAALAALRDSATAALGTCTTAGAVPTTAAVPSSAAKPTSYAAYQASPQQTSSSLLPTPVRNGNSSHIGGAVGEQIQARKLLFGSSAAASSSKTASRQGSFSQSGGGSLLPPSNARHSSEGPEPSNSLRVSTARSTIGSSAAPATNRDASPSSAFSSRSSALSAAPSPTSLYHASLPVVRSASMGLQPPPSPVSSRPPSDDSSDESDAVPLPSMRVPSAVQAAAPAKQGLISRLRNRTSASAKLEDDPVPQWH
jgi:hypothetical protein